MSAVTESRIAVLEWIARLGPVSAEALSVRHGATLASSRARLGAAVRAGQLSRSAPLRGVPASYDLTRAGMRASGARGGVPPRVGPAAAAHVHACALVAVHLELRYGQVVVGERALRARGRHAAAGLSCSLGGVSAAGMPSVHSADLVVERRRGSDAAPVAVEVELTVKAPDRLLRICRAWARCRSVGGVLYVASPAAERAVLGAIAAAGAGDRIVVIPLATLLASRG
ncbi:MAG TPA: hypothetical protein VHT27_00430 [Solirubrobacteraceae bacterium]|jgi:hypothetical protein|nr:hypothetical protein [Solirubrobacteraceae bacterium]